MKKVFSILVILVALVAFATEGMAAMTLADVGADVILNTFFNNTAQQNLKLKLFCTNVSPADTDTVGSYTLCAGGNCDEVKTLTNNSWTVTTGNDPSDAVYAEQTWTLTGACTTNGTIYGYIVTDNAGTTLIWAEATTNMTPANNGDTYKITPKFQLSKGTPN